jgi:hypothetical protein
MKESNSSRNKIALNSQAHVEGMAQRFFFHVNIGKSLNLDARGYWSIFDCKQQVLSLHSINRSSMVGPEKVIFILI